MRLSVSYQFHEQRMTERGELFWGHESVFIEFHLYSSEALAIAISPPNTISAF